MKDSHINRIIRGGGVGIFGEVVVLLAGFLIVMLSVRTLGPREYGIFALSLTIMGILEVICKQGMHKGMLKEITQYRVQGLKAEANAVFWYSFVRTAVTALVVGSMCIFASQSIVHFFHKEDILQTYLIVLACTLPTNVAFAVFLSALQSVGRVRQMVLLENVYKPCLTLCLLAILYYVSKNVPMGSGKTLFFLGIQFGVSLIITIAAYRLLRNSDLSLFGAKNEFNKKEYLHFSYPLLFQGIISMVATWTSTLMIGYFIVQPQEVGAFNVIFKISSFCVLALTALDRAFAPIIGELYYQRAHTELLRIYRSVTKWSLICALVVFAAIVFIGGDVLGLFDSSYHSVYIPLIILGLGRVFDASVGSVAYILLMVGESKIIFYNSLVILLLNVVMNFLLVPRWGLLGGAIATGISYCIKNIVWLVFVMKKTHLNPYSKTYFVTVGHFLICLAVIGTSAHFMPEHWLYNAINLVLFLALWAILYWFWGKDDLDQAILSMVYKRLAFKR